MLEKQSFPKAANVAYALSQQFLGRHLRAGGYFAASSGNATDNVIAGCIKNQDITENLKQYNFGIDEL
ncbi:MAG: hypothetical protein FWG10_09060 [Eubacteriaceae bacterium]|nr:hypothetical protein [Eubacteriaceae bacterium]